jgi:DNA-binding CsgD family transcriptional regulator
VDAAVNSGVLVEMDGQVRFDHPLLSRVAYQQLPPGRRLSLHQEAAAVAASVEERATHLAHTTTGPDLEIAELLDEASRMAFARNARDAAGALSQHAARLTDPRDVESLGRRLADVAWALTESQPEPASAAADGVLQLGLRGPDRARALQVKNETSPTWQESLRWLAEARAEPGLDPILSVNLRAEHAWISGCLRGSNLDEACQEARAAVEAAAGMSPSVRIGVMAVWCWLSSLRGDPETTARFEEALALDGPDVQPTNRFFIRIPFAGHLAAHGRWADAIAQLDAQVAAAQRHGDDVALAMAYASRARLELTRGDADALDRHLALLGTPAARDPTSRTELSVIAALAQARRGDPAAPAAAAAAADISLEDLAFGPGWVARTVAAVTRVTNGQPEMAAEEFATWVDLVADGPIPRLELVTLYPEAVIALVSAGRGSDAAFLLDALNRPGRPEPLATVVDDYGRGLIALGQGDTTSALTHLHAARTAATAIDARWLIASAAFAQGQTLHRAGRRSEAAEAFTTSAAHFDAMHATTWGERARHRAHAAVPRPRQEHALTPSEAKVVDAAASGMSNTEIAAALFITVPTVEAHLTRAYRKLGIKSRAGLANRLNDRNPQQPPQ